MSNFKLKILTIISFLNVVVLNTYAEEEKLPIETKYDLTSGESEVTTIVRKDTSKQELVKDYIFPKIVDAIKSVPQVGNVVFIPGGEIKEEYSWANFVTMKRSSFAYVNLNLSSQVSLLFKVNEELRKCKPPSEQKLDSSAESWEGSSSTECGINSLKSEVTVEGPVAIYGTFVSNVDVNKLLKDKQQMSVVVETNYSQEFQIKTSFKILSSSFEDSLMKFFEIFQVKSVVETQLTRRKLLVGVARAMRNINEKVLEL